MTICPGGMSLGHLQYIVVYADLSRGIQYKQGTNVSIQFSVYFFLKYSYRPDTTFPYEYLNNRGGSKFKYS